MLRPRAKAQASPRAARLRNLCKTRRAACICGLGRSAVLQILACAAALACVGLAQASVVMTGTRVIYPASLLEQTVQFHNPDAHPNVVQVWLDDGDREAALDAATTPFMALPQVFRMEVDGGQVVRLLLTDPQALAQDRESVFYLNFSQLPIRKKTAESNRLLLMFTSRVKVFYRPEALDATLPPDIGGQLQFAWRDGSLHVHNPTPYHVVVSRAELAAGAQPLALSGATMIAPFADAAWPAPAGSAASMPLRLTLRNDYGADVTMELRIPES